MKKTTLIVVLLCVMQLSAQHANRYYPPVKNLFNEPHDRQMPVHFNYFDNWIKNLTQAVFYKDLQQSASSKGDASFLSMGLIFKRQNNFAIGNSGLLLTINKDKPDFSVPVNIQLEQKLRILAYLRSFDANSYDPADLRKKYELALMVFNLSEEQILAAFINRHANYQDKKTTPVQQLLADLKKKAKVTVAIDEKNDRQILKSIATQVYAKTGKYASVVLYDIYIKAKDPKQEARNFADFFRKFHPGDASAHLDETVAYEATVAIPKTELSLEIPAQAILLQPMGSADKGTSVAKTLEVRPRQIAMKTIYTGSQKFLEFTLTLAKSNDSTAFTAPQEIRLNKSANLPDSRRELTTFRVTDITQLVLSLAEKELTLEIVVKTEGWDRRYVIMKQPWQ